jgi:hypothetical protein
MSRQADGTNTLFADFGNSWWVGPSGITLCFWINDNGAGWPNFDDWLSIGGGALQNDGRAMTVQQRSSPYLTNDLNTLVGDEDVSLPNPTTMSGSTWYMVTAWCTLNHGGGATSGGAHGIALGTSDVATTDNAVTNWENSGEDTARYLSVLQNLNAGATMASGLISCISIWDGVLASSERSQLAGKTNPRDLTPGAQSGAVLKALFLDENEHGTGTEEYLDAVGGNVSLSEQAGSVTYNASEPGIAAYSGGGGGGGQVWAANTGIITDGSGFRGFIR